MTKPSGWRPRKGRESNNDYDNNQPLVSGIESQYIDDINESVRVIYIQKCKAANVHLLPVSNQPSITCIISNINQLSNLLMIASDIGSREVVSCLIRQYVHQALGPTNDPGSKTPEPICEI